MIFQIPWFFHAWNFFFDFPGFPVLVGTLAVAPEPSLVAYWVIVSPKATFLLILKHCASLSQDAKLKSYSNYKVEIY